MSKWKIKNPNGNGETNGPTQGLLALEELAESAKDLKQDPGKQVENFCNLLAEAYEETLGTHATVHTTTAIWARAMEQLTFGTCASSDATVEQYVQHMTYTARVFAECLQVLVASRVMELERAAKESAPLIKLQ